MPETQKVIAEWVDLYTERLLAWAYYKVPDPELAKDLVQDTFLAAMQQAGGFEGRSSPSTWLMAILNHKIADHYRKEMSSPIGQRPGREEPFFDDEGMWLKDRRPGPWDADPHLLDDASFVATLRSCLGKLPRAWEMAVTLKYLCGKDGHEICKELDVSATNYWQMIRRAKMNLRECLEVNWFK